VFLHFVNNKDQQRVKEQLSNGKVRLVIGTHSIFSATFNNLALIIVDEEHQFGVKQKERLKSIKSDANVLSLTATPIPRTLQMSLVGIRDLSIIATAPFERLPVKVVIIDEKQHLILEAINRELQRGGKIFYVCPRLEEIENIYQQLKQECPQFNIKIAHGQMPPAILDKTLEEFYDGAFDILLSTNIVQSGLDVPNANTIIVNNAHLFGLAQLHQLRGRVGRKKKQGYCYFISPVEKIGRLGYQRLEIIASNNELGSGFNISSHDVDIRGYGNLLGDEQSGHVKEVGSELYHEMLQQEIARINSSALQESEFSPNINTGVPIYIAKEYIEDESVRLLTYRRIAKIETEQDFNSLANELEDRFGVVPEEVKNLFGILKLKNICRKMQITDLDVGPNGLLLKFYKQADFEKIINFVQKNPKYSKLRKDGSLVLLKQIAQEAKLAQITKELQNLEQSINA
jgi:transcription-repair coupling factor (superfamily II helicase)